MQGEPGAPTSTVSCGTGDVSELTEAPRAAQGPSRSWGRSGPRPWGLRGRGEGQGDRWDGASRGRRTTAALQSPPAGGGRCRAAPIPPVPLSLPVLRGQGGGKGG